MPKPGGLGFPRARSISAAGRGLSDPVRKRRRLNVATTEPSPETLPRLLRAAVAAHAERIAFTHGETPMSYAALGEAVETLADAIATRVVPGDRVALLAARSPVATIGAHAALAAGGVLVPLPASGPIARTRTIVDDCDAQLVLSDTAYAGLASRLERPTLAIEDAAEASPPRQPDVAPQPDDLAYLLYTSGSTGRPKGVTWDHGGAAAFPKWCVSRFELTPDDRVAAVAALTFDLSTFDLYAALAAGAEVLFPPHEALLFPATLAAWIAEHRPTVLYAVPTLFTRLIEHNADLSSLRVVLFAGEVFPVPALVQLIASVGAPALERAGGVLFENLYGPTETNVCTSYRLPGPLEETAAPIPIGHVLPHLSAVGPTEGRGELVIEGEAVMRGYWGSLDASTPRRHATGDIVERRTDGVFTFHGRSDRMVKVRGHRVELGEVEHALARHPAVREAAATVRKAASGEAVRAYYVADEDPGARRLRTHCAGLLPAYMVPSELVRLDALPRTSNGKIALSELE